LINFTQNSHTHFMITQPIYLVDYFSRATIEWEQAPRGVFFTS